MTVLELSSSARRHIHVKRARGRGRATLAWSLSIRSDASISSAHHVYPSFLEGVERDLELAVRGAAMAQRLASGNFQAAAISSKTDAHEMNSDGPKNASQLFCC
jgi:hypothetical protein